MLGISTFRGQGVEGDAAIIPILQDDASSSLSAGRGTGDMQCLVRLYLCTFSKVPVFYNVLYTPFILQELAQCWMSSMA